MITQDLISIVHETTHLRRMHGLDFGWGNGYVLIPKGHRLWGKDYDMLHSEYDIQVHGGLTFSSEVTAGLIKNFKGAIPQEHLGSWIVGFDTAHAYDTLSLWPKHRVQWEADELKRQLVEIMRVPTALDRVEHLYTQGVITHDEHKRLLEMINSEDRDNLTVAESVIEEKLKLIL